jgi:dolichol-phosphate mannosyltransferase
VLVLLYHGATLSFVASQVAATISAMIFNFWLNNVATFRDRRLQGWRFVEGLFTFCIACSVGALVNVSFAKLLTQSGIAWPLAGICGMAISSVWNYGVNTILTWHRSRSWGAIKN